MPIKTGWVDPPTAIGGLDHLGTQAPCILVYSQLLPGITNVTDRARYYSFYPWVIWSLERRFPKADYASFVERYRRADCLFTLIAERHARETDKDGERHGVAMVGRIKLTAALTALEGGTRLLLSRFTAQDSDTRYFKNPLGGLGQYYAGILTDLAILDSRSSKWINYSKERGRPIAESFDKAVDGDLFWRTCEGDAVTLKALDRLATFCPCYLTKSPREHQHLQTLFFSRPPYDEGDGPQRRSSLAMLLHLTEALRQFCPGEDLSQNVFRGGIYSGHLPTKIPWTLPPSLGKTRSLWAIYERGDLLSIAFQGQLGAALSAMELTDERFKTVEAFVRHYMSTETVRDYLIEGQGRTFGQSLEEFIRTGPALNDWQHADHEIQAADRIVERFGDKTFPKSELIAASTGCLVALAARDQTEPWDYNSVGWTDDVLADYPVNLVSFRRRVTAWLARPMGEVLAEVVQWALETHLRVALRKLRQTGQSSFRFRPTELGFEVVDVVPSPAHTIPRFNQAAQILRDIGMLNRKQGLTGLSALGRQQLESLRA